MQLAALTAYRALARSQPSAIQIVPLAPIAGNSGMGGAGRPAKIAIMSNGLAGGVDQFSTPLRVTWIPAYSTAAPHDRSKGGRCSQATPLRLSKAQKRVRVPPTEAASRNLLGYPFEDAAGVALKDAIGGLVAQSGNCRQEIRYLPALVTVRGRFPVRYTLRRIGQRRLPRTVG